MLNNFDAVIFDMDGLLLDSETIALATFIEACREIGFEPSNMGPYFRCIGTNWATTRDILIEGYGDVFMCPGDFVDGADRGAALGVVGHDLDLFVEHQPRQTVSGCAVRQLRVVSLG